MKTNTNGTPFWGTRDGIGQVGGNDDDPGQPPLGWVVDGLAVPNPANVDDAAFAACAQAAVEAVKAGA